MMKTILKRSFFVAILASVAITAFAEDAPVYDVDNYPPQFDGQSDGGTPAPAAPRPAQKVEAQEDQTSQPLQPLSLDQRVSRLEQQANNSLHSDASTKLQDAQTEIQSLRGQVEELTHQLQTLQAQQKKMYSDIDKRLSRKGGAAAAAPAATALNQNQSDANFDASDSDADNNADSDTPADTIKTSKTKLALPPSAVGSTDKVLGTSDDTKSVASADAQPNNAEEQQIYQSAYNLIKAKKYDQAAKALQKMLQKYPSGQFAANAHYWLGELYGLMGKNDQAVTEFTSVVTNYPDSPKLADAQLKLGLIYAAQFKWPDAKTAFKKVVSTYPGTSFARLASEQLKQIKQAGH